MPPPRPVRILDVGASPYLMQVLLYDLFGEGVELTTISRPSEVWPGTINVVNKRLLEITRQHKKRLIQDYQFNVEKEKWPFEEEFDLVLCTEIIEHLIQDPSHMLYGIHRSLKKGGILILSTNNACQLQDLLFLLVNRNPWYPYYKNGIYARHNRFYTQKELLELLKLHNFDILEAHLMNWPKPHSAALKKFAYFFIHSLTNLPIPYLANKREHHFIVCKSTGPHVKSYPSWLYAGMEA